MKRSSIPEFAQAAVEETMPKLSCRARIATRILQSLGFSFILVVVAAQAVRAADVETVSTPRFTLYIGSSGNSDSGRRAVTSFTSETITLLDKTFSEVNRIFDATPNERVVLRFLAPEDFTKQTGAPSWTSAMFYKGEISIPVSSSRRMSEDELRRTLRHEYVHAVTAELSGQRVPAWLDEGLAQLVEGTPNSLLGPALRNWIRQNPAMSLSELQNGFMTFDNSLVPTAYAHSLFATRSLVNSYGFTAMRTYLAMLREGEKYEDAFRASFGRPQGEFESDLGKQIRLWAASDSKDP